MFPIAFIQTLKLFIKFNLHSCSFWSINSASSGFWPLFHDSFVPRVLVSFLLSSCPLETIRYLHWWRNTLAEGQDPLLLVLWPPSELGKRACSKVPQSDVILRLSTPMQTCSSGHCLELLPQHSSFPEVTFACDDCQGQTLQTVLVREQWEETVQLASAFHSCEDGGFDSVDPGCTSNSLFYKRHAVDSCWPRGKKLKGETPSFAGWFWLGCVPFK